MKIFDCFMYFDEEVVLDLRLNTLSDYIDYFVIVESKFTHKGDERELKFNHKKFEKFKKKIIYLVYDEEPKEIEKVLEKIISITGLEKNFQLQLCGNTNNASALTIME